MTPMATGYLEAAGTVGPLLRSDGIALRWEAPSALPKMSVGALAGHLASQVVMVTGLLRADQTTDAEIVPLLDHYTRVAWVGADLDDEVNVAIRAGGARTAEAGPAALADSVDAAVQELPSLLGSRPDDPVLLPWTGWALSLDDFLVTRTMEIAVHSDDLAASMNVSAPALGAAALDPVLRLLTALSLRRHGQSAVLTALSRAERAPTTIAAF